MEQVTCCRKKCTEEEQKRNGGEVYYRCKKPGHEGPCYDDEMKIKHHDTCQDCGRCEADIRNEVIEECAKIAHDVQRNAHGLDGFGLAELIADTIRERKM